MLCLNRTTSFVYILLFNRIKEGNHVPANMRHCHIQLFMHVKVQVLKINLVKVSGPQLLLCLCFHV